MKKLESGIVEDYVNTHITGFHEKRLQILANLTLNRLIDKNPYLFRAKNILIASELISNTLAAFLSSSEEKIFGDFLEDLAVFIAGLTVGGHKSSAQGIDLEFLRGSKHYLVSIKSGENWGNSSQHKKMVDDFQVSAKRIRQSSQHLEPQPTLGICYGRRRTSFHKLGYLCVVGQNFWSLISDNKELYTEIIEPLGFRAKEHNDNFEKERAKITNLLTIQFIERFCNSQGEINWVELVKSNSGNYDLDKYQL